MMCIALTHRYSLKGFKRPYIYNPPPPVSSELLLPYAPPHPPPPPPPSPLPPPFREAHKAARPTSLLLVMYAVQ